MNIKTIDVNAKEWRDRTYGNSYFSAVVVINYRMEGSASFKIPFQYGYGDHFIDIANQELHKRGYISNPRRGVHQIREPLWQYCEDHGIILRTNKTVGCRKRDL